MLHFLKFSLNLGQLALRNVGQREKEIYQQIIGKKTSNHWIQDYFQRLTINGLLSAWEPYGTMFQGGCSLRNQC